jgi:hypothetical protein
MTPDWVTNSGAFATFILLILLENVLYQSEAKVTSEEKSF